MTANFNVHDGLGDPSSDENGPFHLSTVTTLFTAVRRSHTNAREQIELNQPLKKSEHMKFDKILYHFSMVSDKMENLSMFRKDRKDRQLNFQKRLHNATVWLILAAYAIRSLACFMTDNRRVLLYLGDISPYLGGNRYMYLIPVQCWAFYALALNSMFTFDPKSMEWLHPFGLVKGLVSPYEAGFYSMRQVKKILLRVKLTSAAIDSMISSPAILAGLLFMTIPFYKYENKSDAIWWGVPWGVLQGVWTYYCAGNICGSFGYFHMLCYYLTVRFRYVNEQVKYLLKNRNSMTALKLNRSIIEMVNEHSEVTTLVDRYNRYWRRYAGINYFTFIPLECFLLFIAMFAKIDFMIWLTFAVLAVDCGAILGIVVLSGAMVSQEVSVNH